MPTKVTAKTYLAAVKKGYDLEYQLADCQKDKLILEAMVKEQQAQLAEANSKLDKYSGMCVSCPDMGMTLVVERLEQELAEANDKARLQVALDRIEKAGYGVISDTHHATVLIPGYYCAQQMRFDGTRLEAAEAAAAWAEQQKEGKA